jgi:ferrous iron transport protein B
MHCHDPQAGPDAAPGEAVVLVGNPNVGKSVIFSHLTGRYAEVSNYPGTTVEVTRGQMTLNGSTAPVIDTPGVNSLMPRSEDERVTRDILLAEPPRAVVQVADAKNLRRALLLTVQLAEMGVPMALVLNMQDEARSRGIQVNADELGRRLGVDVIPTVATRNEGLVPLPEAIRAARASGFGVQYDGTITAAVMELESLLPDGTPGARALAVMALGGDDIPPSFPAEAHPQVDTIRRETAARYEVPLAYTITEQRLRCVDCLVEVVYKKQESTGRLLGEQLSRLAMHPLWGWPILGLVLFALYEFVGVLGAGTLVDFFEGVVFGEWINPWVTQLIGRILPVPFLYDLLVGDYGIVTMALSYGIAIVLPIVTTFFIAFSLLEDSGYLPRLAVMVNRPFKALGLNGKAVLPMVLGLGCDTMATMTTRILETRKERLQVTLLLALGVPCSAQLGVILGMVGFVSRTGLLVWAGVVIGVMFVVGWLASKVIPGESSDFIIELPPIRAPRLDNIVFKTIARLEWYLKEVLPLFILGTLILFTLDRVGGLAFVEQAASPVVEELLGLPREATGAFLIGFLRRDYGAAGLFALARQGMMTSTQVIVSLVVITLFMPCIANFLMIIKEYGRRTAVLVTGFVFPLAFAVGGALNALVRALSITF